ncbi:hypothetical protein PtA15_4A655 [Puccinia triticina]|uniref:Uncharacterized protein n=1 Tax=Puccinia triticina TaxID=208348 RepID=A0ABY7CG75_9BASI|nr:uncharacterized protein PtA15_4A655 [Puccinia triticina]WAQ84203.1 hypothetical protein PtA15_4A655 [Puccinia triticina]
MAALIQNLTHVHPTISPSPKFQPPYYNVWLIPRTRRTTNTCNMNPRENNQHSHLIPLLKLGRQIRQSNNDLHINRKAVILQNPIHQY